MIRPKPERGCSLAPALTKLIEEGSKMADKAHKTCVRCNQDLPLDAFFSARNRPDGKYPYCRQCNKDWVRERAAKDPKAEAERRARKKVYDAEYNKRHKLKKSKQVKRRYEAKAEEIKAKIREWQVKNKERVRAYKATNKARRRSSFETGIKGADLLLWKQQQAKVCYWCKAKCARHYHVDHYVPLAKGGKHEIGNLVISCPTCNLRKNAKDPFEFAREIGRLL
jgi:5-methylcytosine-specific restriction endonuclease McrA